MQSKFGLLWCLNLMIHNWLLLVIGADINAQTDETQETALSLACCGGFLEVADFLIKAAADIELGCSTPLMEAAQEGHLELVKYLLKAGMSSIITNTICGYVDAHELHVLARHVNIYLAVAAYD